MQQRQRYHILDTIRGICIVVMIGYHGLWTLQNMFGVSIPWFTGTVAHWIQQIFASTFIILAGYCWSLGRSHIKRGVQVVLAGGVISAVTILFMPSAAIWFGVLTLTGSAMLALTVLEPALKPINPLVGLMGAVVLAVLFKPLSSGYVSLWDIWSLELPSWLYANKVTTFFGFAHPGFYSADYFPFLTWFPVFMCGYFLYRMHLNLPTGSPWAVTKPLRFLGRHALVIYLFHQVAIYAVCTVVFAIFPLYSLFK